MERTEQITPQPSPTTAHTFDNHGSPWGQSSPQETEADIAAAHRAGTPVHEWHTHDRDGHPMRVIRIPDPEFLDTITVITAPAPTAATA